MGNLSQFEIGICGQPQFGQSEAPEVGGIWPEVGGKPPPIFMFFSAKI